MKINYYLQNNQILASMVMAQINPASTGQTNPLLTLFAGAANMSVTAMLQNMIMSKKKDILKMHTIPITFDKKQEDGGQGSQTRRGAI